MIDKVKIPVKFAEGLAPFCPFCGSGEYMYNEDENENNFCGQCGTPLDWEHMENIETDEVIKIRKKQERNCGTCKYYKPLKNLNKGKCEINRKSPRNYNQVVCKKYDIRTKDFYKYKECGE